MSAAGVEPVDGGPAKASEILLGPVWAALSAGYVHGMVAAAERAVAAAPELAPAHELLGGLCVSALDDYPRSRHHLERAYRLHREGRDLRAAARCAIMLAQLEETAGNLAGLNGWLGRARRLIDEIGHCVEEGYYSVAMLACDVADVNQLERSATFALALAREFGDTDLEVRALADSGLALISLGRTADGLARLDEAVTAVLAGEVQNLGTRGLTCCALVSACDRLGDVDRLHQMIEGMDRWATERFNGFRWPILLAHCRLTYGGMLSEAGRWREAEVELRDAVEASKCVGHRAAAMARLAALRVHQNRIAEAEELLRGLEDRIEVAPALARVHDARGELDLAASTLRRALREQETDLLTTPPLLAQLADVELRRGDRRAAGDAADRLEAIARALASSGVRAMALLARGRIQAAAGEDAEPALVDALRELRGEQRPQLRAEINLALAEAKRGHDAPGAVSEARAGLAIFERLGARRDAARAAALLRSLGVSVRTGTDAERGRRLDALSRREREVVPPLAEGLSNAEIAARLFITPKTVEHHVGSILSKLGMRTRAEVAAWAVNREIRGVDEGVPLT
jgi:DNA-binding NarL/FixJ family response regulator